MLSLALQMKPGVGLMKEFQPIPILRKNAMQFWLKNKLDRENFSEAVDRAIMKGLRQKGSGSWLLDFPSKNIGTSLDNIVIRCCMRLRLS